MFVDPEASPNPEVRKLRHDIRGCMHGLSLCMAALETPMSRADKAEFLSDIETASSRMDELLVKWEQCAPDA